MEIHEYLHAIPKPFMKNIGNISFMGEGFTLLTRLYGFMGGGGVPPPFWHVKECTSTYYMTLKFYR